MIEGCPNCPWRERYFELKRETTILHGLVLKLYEKFDIMDEHDETVLALEEVLKEAAVGLYYDKV